MRFGISWLPDCPLVGPAGVGRGLLFWLLGIVRLGLLRGGVFLGEIFRSR